MAVRNDFAPGEVLAAADLNDSLDAKANLASPTFTGTPAAPTAAAGTNTTQLATTAFVQGAGGLTLITSEAFSAVSSVSLNNVFTSTYSAYFITATYNVAATSNKSLTLRMRTSGTDNSTSTYITTTGTTITGYATSIALGNVYGAGGAGSNGFFLTLLQPQEAAVTKGYGGVFAGTSTNILPNYLAVLFDATTQFDGFTFLTDTSTFTGTVRVYGYKI